MRIAHLNANSLPAHLTEVITAIREHNLDIFTISETWLTPDSSENLLNIAGYNFVRNDRDVHSDSDKRKYKLGGGVACYLRENIFF